MANRIAKGFSVCTAIVGVLCLMTGGGIAVCAWVLGGILPTGFYYSSDGNSVNISVDNYWWGGMIYVIPGILGIIAGCTRNVCAMVLYMIFNIICCICSLVVVVICGLAIAAWSVVNDRLQNGICVSASNNCVCTDFDDVIMLYGASCDNFLNVETVVSAMVAMGALSTLLSFISSYVSCCSLCNQEATPVGNIIITGGNAGVYQPPPVVINNTNAAVPGYPPVGGMYHPNQVGGAPQGGYYYPPPAGNNAYGAQGGFPMPYSTCDTSKLVKNEVI